MAVFECLRREEAKWYSPAEIFEEALSVPIPDLPYVDEDEDEDEDSRYPRESMSDLVLEFNDWMMNTGAWTQKRTAIGMKLPPKWCREWLDNR